jgi:hypothetical protein
MLFRESILLFVVENAVRSLFAIKPSRKKSTLAQAGGIIWIHESNKHKNIHKRERIIEVKIKNEEKNYNFFGIYSPEEERIEENENL